MLAAVPAIAQTRSWPKEPKDYHGIRFGAGEKEVYPAIVARSETSEDSISFGQDIYAETPTRSAKIKVGVLSETYMLYDGKLGMIFLDFASSDYEALRDAFIARYGRPHSVERGTVQNGFGATFQQEKVRWVGKRIAIRLTRFVGDLTRGTGSLMTTDFLAVAGNAAAEAKRERADR